MRNSFWIFFAVVLLIGAVPRAFSADEALAIKKVMDGETLELNDGRRIRLIGIATQNVRPILEERFREAKDQMRSLPLATLPKEATDFIEQTVLGRNIILSFDPNNEAAGHKDKHGRWLAYVWYTIHYQARADEGKERQRMGKWVADDRLLNSEMIRLGHAFVDTTRLFSQKELFLRYESEAMSARSGIWRTAAEIYQDIMKRAKGMSAGAVADFVPQEVREMSLKSSRNSLTELIEQDPQDYRSYYERSWLGANSLHHQISKDNLEDIDKAIELAPENPKCHIQRHYLLRLLGNHAEAARSYQKAIQLAARLGMPTAVSDFVSDEAASGQLTDPVPKKNPKSLNLVGFVADAFRATLNEDHFLIFMARYKKLKGLSEPLPAPVVQCYENFSKRAKFQGFYAKHRDELESASPESLIYKTQWALRGNLEPEKVMEWMEKMGAYEAPSEKPEVKPSK